MSASTHVFVGQHAATKRERDRRNQRLRRYRERHGPIGCLALTIDATTHLIAAEDFGAGDELVRTEPGRAIELVTELLDRWDVAIEARFTGCWERAGESEPSTARRVGVGSLRAVAEAKRRLPAATQSALGVAVEVDQPLPRGIDADEAGRIFGDLIARARLESSNDGGENE